MSSDFNTRFTHALLICVIMLLTKETDSPWRELFHFQFLVLMCFGWAYGFPALQRWIEKREKAK